MGSCECTSRKTILTGVEDRSALREYVSTLLEIDKWLHGKVFPGIRETKEAIKRNFPDISPSLANHIAYYHYKCLRVPLSLRISKVGDGGVIEAYFLKDKKLEVKPENPLFHKHHIEGYEVLSAVVISEDTILLKMEKKFETPCVPPSPNTISLFPAVDINYGNVVIGKLSGDGVLRSIRIYGSWGQVKEVISRFARFASGAFLGVITEGDVCYAKNFSQTKRIQYFASKMCENGVPVIWLDPKNAFSHVCPFTGEYSGVKKRRFIECDGSMIDRDVVSVANQLSVFGKVRDISHIDTTFRKVARIGFDEAFSLLLSR